MCLLSIALSSAPPCVAECSTSRARHLRLRYHPRGRERRSQVDQATIGLVTIGQSPRPDIREGYKAVLGPMPIIEAGALAGPAPAEVRDLSPAVDDVPLVTLAHGDEVRIGKRAVTPLLQRAIDRVVAAGASVVAVLCTGHFEGLT